MPRLFAHNAGLPHTTDMRYDAGEDPDSPVFRARGWCAERVAPDGRNLRCTPETCYVRFGRETDAVLYIVVPGGTYRKQPTPRTEPRRNPWLEARLAYARPVEARADAEWEE